MNAIEMRREMLETVRVMREELDLVARLDEDGENELVPLRLRLTWLEGRFAELRRVEAQEMSAMRRTLLRVGDHSLDPDEAEVGDRTRAVAGGVNTGGLI